MSEDRKKIWIDSFQTKIALRMGAYFVASVVVVFNLLFAWELLIHGPADQAQTFVDTLKAHLPMFICLFVLMPVMAWDMVMMTHRMEGPIVRFRHTINAIANGEPVRPIKLRKDDYLTE